MLTYPSILGINKFPLNHNCYAFYKYDGSNLRFEWNNKRGWHKFGSRTQLIDINHPIFGIGIEQFMDTMKDEIINRISSNYNLKHIKNITAFAEFYGENSFAGNHVENEEKQLKLFDVCLFQKGFINPKEFVELFSDWDKSAELIYQGNLNQEFILNVRNNTLPILLNEGVICKGINDKSKVVKYGTTWMTKIKTLSYLDKLKNTFNDKWELYGE
jgi:hypothetical protein